MGGVFGGQTVRSDQAAQIPDQLKPLFQMSANHIQDLQTIPGSALRDFMANRPRQVAGMSPNMSYARDMVGRVGQTPEAETRARQLAGMAPWIAGRANQGYNAYNVLQAPRQMGRAEGIYGNMAGRASQVPQGFGNIANRSNQLAGYAQQVPQGFANVARSMQGMGQYGERVPTVYRDAVSRANELMPIAQQVPEQYGQQTQAARNLMGIADDRVGGVNEMISAAQRRQGEFGEAANYARSLVGQARQVPGMFGDVRQQAIRDFGNIGKGNISQDPTLQAAQQAFAENVLPQIQNEAALAGLGRSTAMTRAHSAANAQMMLPLIQDIFSRQERGVNLAADLGLQQAMAGERGIERGVQAGQFATGAMQEAGRAGERGIEREMAARQAQMGEDRARLERMLQTGQFGVGVGLEEASARERGIQRQLDTGRLGVDTLLQQAAAAERGIERGMQGRQMTADYGLQAAMAGERGIERGTAARQAALDYGLQAAMANERGIERRFGADQAAAQGMFNIGQADTMRRMEMAAAQERATGLRAQMAMQGAGLMGQLGQQQTNRTIQEVGMREMLGQTSRDIQQQRYDAMLDDMLRRQGIAETAIFQPFGQIAPSSIGQSSVQRQRGLLK